MDYTKTMEYYDKDGNPVDGVLSADDVQSIQDSKAELEAKLEANKQELEKLSDKDRNFEALRSLNAEQKAKVESLQSKISQSEADELARQQEIKATEKSRMVDSVLREVAGSDEELQKKAKYHFDRMKDSELATTKEEVEKSMKDALILARGGQSTPSINQVVSSSGAPVSTPQTKEYTPELKNAGSSFGLSAEDFEKYG
jgi:hypothetical protein